MNFFIVEPRQCTKKYTFVILFLLKNSFHGFKLILFKILKYF